MTETALRFMADESCDFSVVRALRREGYNVLAGSEYMQRSDDRLLIEQAAREKRVFLSEDKDFGWLVYVSHADSAGVTLLLSRLFRQCFGRPLVDAFAPHLGRAGNSRVHFRRNAQHQVA